MAITTRDGLIAAVAAGPAVQFQKTSMTTVSGYLYTLFRNAGMPGTAGTAPASTGVALSRTSVGALPIPAPSGTSYITAFRGTSSLAGGLVVADRLVEFGGLSGAVTTEQTVSALALPARATGATDVELWLEIYTAVGSTAAPTVTASYTNSSSVAGRTATLAIPASGGVINRVYQFALEAGDTGVKSVESLTLGTSTGTAGNLGMVLRRTLAAGHIPSASMGFVQGYAETDLQICPNDACLELLWAATATFTGQILGAVGIAQG